MEVASRVIEPLKVSRPVLPSRGSIRSSASEESVALKGVRFPGEDVNGVGLTYVAGVGGGGRALAQRGQILVLLGDGGGAGAGRRGEVVLEHGARRHGVGVEAEPRGAVLAVAGAAAAR